MRWREKYIGTCRIKNMKRGRVWCVNEHSDPELLKFLKRSYFKEKGEEHHSNPNFWSQTAWACIGSRSCTVLLKKKGLWWLIKHFFSILQHCILNDCLWHTRHWCYLLPQAPVHRPTGCRGTSDNVQRQRYDTVINRVNTFFLQFCNTNLPCVSKLTYSELKALFPYIYQKLSLRTLIFFFFKRNFSL